MDDGGRFKVDGVTVRGGASTTWGAGNRIGVTLSYDQYDYSFDNVSAFGAQAPWGDVRRYGVSVPVSWALSNNWSLTVAPSVDWFDEKSASNSESRVWGAMVYSRLSRRLRETGHDSFRDYLSWLESALLHKASPLSW